MQITKLIVDRDKFKNVTLEGCDHLGNLLIGNTHKVNQILIQRNSTNYDINLDEIDNIGRNQSFKIVIRSKGSEFELPLSEDIINGLVAYFNDRERDSYHCIQFGRYLFKEGPPFGKTNLQPREVTLKRISSGDLIIMRDSSSILLSDSNGQTYGYVHVAIYIGEGYYISKLGGGKNDKIVVSSLEELQRIYPYDEIKAFRNKSDSLFTIFLNRLKKTL